MVFYTLDRPLGGFGQELELIVFRDYESQNVVYFSNEMALCATRTQSYGILFDFPRNS